MTINIFHGKYSVMDASWLFCEAPYSRLLWCMNMIIKQFNGIRYKKYYGITIMLGIVKTW